MTQHGTAKNITFLKLSFETPSFNFEVCGDDELRLRKLLEEAWQTHAAQTGADPSYLTGFADDIELHTISFNTVYRNKEPISSES